MATWEYVCSGVRKGRSKGDKSIIHSYSQPQSHTPSSTRTSPASSLHITASTDPQTAWRLAAWVVWPRGWTHTWCQGLSIQGLSVLIPSVTTQRRWLWRQHLPKAASRPSPASWHHVHVPAFKQPGWHRVSSGTPRLLGTDGPATLGSPEPCRLDGLGCALQRSLVLKLALAVPTVRE